MAKQGLPAKYARMGFAKGWKAYKAAKGGAKKRVRSVATKVKTRVSRGFRIGNKGAMGVAEDLAIGYVGATLIRSRGYSTAQSLALTRVAQGVAGKALNRRGKDRLVNGVVDYIDAVMLEGGRIPILDEILQMAKLR